MPPAVSSATTSSLCRCRGACESVHQSLASSAGEGSGTRSRSDLSARTTQRSCSRSSSAIAPRREPVVRRPPFRASSGSSSRTRGSTPANRRPKGVRSRFPSGMRPLLLVRTREKEMRRPIPRHRSSSRTAILLTSFLFAATAPAAAVASHEPFAFGDAKRGRLLVVSGALVAPKSVDLRGVWLNEALGCDQWRSLRVNVLIDYTRGSMTRRVRRSRTGAVKNCAEGGPNFGFTIGARRIGLACPNGRWKPGLYTFVVRTTHRATRLRATVSLAWPNRVRC